MTIRALYGFDARAVEAMDLSIQITMPVRDWKRLRDTLSSAGGRGYQESILNRTIGQALADIEAATQKSYSFDDKPK